MTNASVKSSNPIKIFVLICQTTPKGIEAGMGVNNFTVMANLELVFPPKAELPRVGDSGVFVVCANGEVRELPAWRGEGEKEETDAGDGYGDPGYNFTSAGSNSISETR